MTRYSTPHLVLLALGAVLMVGCGGGGASSKSAGRAAVKVDVTWPAAARSASTDAHSVVVTVEIGGQEVGRKVVDRPQGTTQTQTETAFDGLPAGQMRATVTAFSQAAAEGETVGASEDSGALLSGDTLYENVTMPTDGTTMTMTMTKSATGSITVGIH